MTEVVIVDAIRTPMGKARQGIYRNIRAETLSAHLMAEIIQRNPQLDQCDLADVIWGCVKQTKEQGFNIARNAALQANLPHSVPAQTINRLCGSSMQALHTGYAMIKAGLGEAVLVGGVEHMGHVPMNFDTDFSPKLNLNTADGAQNMGMIAELLSKQYDISRTMQDEFALRSHQLAAAAQTKGYWRSEIVPTMGHAQGGRPQLIHDDEVIRQGAALESLSSLRPVFKRHQGTVTAGNASAMSDGASALLVMSAKKANQLGLKIRAIVRGVAASGCEPSVMGLGPVKATEMALAKANLQKQDIQFAEFNEAFAAQALSCIKILGWLDKYDQMINVQGGAIALGHPLGCSGSRITGTLLNIMERTDAQFGLATMCIGFGQGIATVIERPG
jgi:acetyl-CoA acyltransferase